MGLRLGGGFLGPEDSFDGFWVYLWGRWKSGIVRCAGPTNPRPLQEPQVTPSRVVLLHCEECGLACTNPKDWSIMFLVAEPSPAPWGSPHHQVGAYHHTCMAEERVYYEIPTPTGGHTESTLLHWAAHMMEKTWVPAESRFSTFLRSVSEATPGEFH